MPETLAQMRKVMGEKRNPHFLEKLPDFYSPDQWRSIFVRRKIVWNKVV